ncbi:MAG: hypothetical protein AAF206_15990 [Bacteroidota bacterium]
MPHKQIFSFCSLFFLMVSTFSQPAPQALKDSARNLLRKRAYDDAINLFEQAADAFREQDSIRPCLMC